MPRVISSLHVNRVDRVEIGGLTVRKLWRRLNPMEVRVTKLTIQISANEIINRTAVHASMAAAYMKLVLGTFGPSGTNRPSQWPALSRRYARRVSPPVPTLYRRGDLARSIHMTADYNAGHVMTESEIAPYHQFGTSRMPARPFFQFYPNGQPTLAAQEVVTKAAIDSAITR